MKKVGIISMYGIFNYGNRLQNYALYKYVENLGFDAYSIKNYPYSNNKIKNLKDIYHYLKRKKAPFKTSKKRKDNFKKFNNKIKFWNKEITYYNAKKFDFDYFIVGSDQVWNPNYRSLSYIELLSFAEKKKRISYAASFGISKLDEKYHNTARKELLEFNKISVRENTGKEIVEGLTKRNDVEVVIDPTMLLKKEEWDEVSIKPKQYHGEKYILTYFLGELSEERKNVIKNTAKEHDCKIINLLDENDPYYTCGPSEFLWLEKNAFLICTDSFHSSVFAIIYNRPFVVFDRDGQGKNKMGSRIDTLITKFKLKDRKYNEKSITKNNLNCDYSEASIILEKEREKSRIFLENALELNDRGE